MTSRACIAALFVLLLPSTAFAYLDPGTGSALLQGVLGAFAAIGIMLKLYWHRLLRLLGIRKASELDSNKKADKCSDPS